MIKWLWNSITPLNALIIMSFMFYGVGEYRDTWFFYPLGVISFIAWCMTHAICSAIRNASK